MLYMLLLVGLVVLVFIVIRVGTQLRRELRGDDLLKRNDALGNSEHMSSRGTGSNE